MRLKPSLLRNALIAIVVGGIPLFGVLAWLGFIHGTIALVVVALILVVFAAIFIAWRHTEAFVSVDDAVVHKVTFASDREIPITDIARVIIVETEHWSAEGVAQLLALGAHDRRLFRMRGLYWSLEGMHQVADAIGAPTEVEPLPMTLKHFYARYPGAAYWYEGRPWLAALGIGAATALTFGAVIVMMTIAGNPPGS